MQNRCSYTPVFVSSRQGKLLPNTTISLSFFGQPLYISQGDFALILYAVDSSDVSNKTSFYSGHITCASSFQCTSRIFSLKYTTMSVLSSVHYFNSQYIQNHIPVISKINSVNPRFMYNKGILARRQMAQGKILDQKAYHVQAMPMLMYNISI